MLVPSRCKRRAARHTWGVRAVAAREGDGQMHTVVAQSLPVRLRMRLGLPVLGALVGTVLALLTEWFAQVTPLYDGVLGRGGYAGEPTGLLVGAGLGLLLGLVAAITLLGECLRATVGPRAITLTWADARVSVPRRLVTGIVADGDLVLLGPGGVELARVRCRLDRDLLRTALASTGTRRRWRPTPTRPRSRRG